MRNRFMAGITREMSLFLAAINIIWIFITNFGNSFRSLVTSLIVNFFPMQFQRNTTIWCKAPSTITNEIYNFLAHIQNLTYLNGYKAEKREHLIFTLMEEVIFFSELFTNGFQILQQLQQTFQSHLRSICILFLSLKYFLWGK